MYFQGGIRSHDNFSRVSDKGGRFKTYIIKKTAFGEGSFDPRSYRYLDEKIRRIEEDTNMFCVNFHRFRTHLNSLHVGNWNLRRR